MHVVTLCKTFRRAFEAKFKPLANKVNHLWSDARKNCDSVNTKLLDEWLSAGMQH